MAQAMVVLLAIHLMQVIVDGAYKAPREVNFWLGLILMQIVLGLSLTGYLLPWDQKGYWATQVATKLMTLVPVIGTKLQRLVVGGPSYGHHTLTRFFAMHAGVLPALLVGFLALHIAVFRRHGITPANPLYRKDSLFWPEQVLKDAVACLGVLMVVLLLTIFLGAELGAPADPAQPYAAARPEWYFLFLFQFLKVFEGWGATGEFVGAILVPGLIMAAMALMPIVGGWRLGHRFNVAFTLAILAGAGLLTALALDEDYAALWVDRGPLAEAERLHDETGGDAAKLAAALGGDAAKAAAIERQWRTLEKVRRSQAFLDAVKQAKADAARAVELAGRPERIPPAGMLELVRGDPLSQGPRLFAQHCASCHAHVDPLAPDAEAVIAKSSAANLFAFGSADWMRGLLDAEQVAGPAYFGNTAHKDGDMVNFVRDDLADGATWPKADIDAVVAALAAESGRPVPAELAGSVARGRELVAAGDRCGGCHRFRENGTDLGSAPDLTGWGSRDWIVGIVADPTHERFYGDSNDRMPSFGTAVPGALPPLSGAQIGMVADWLAGRWYRPAER